MHLPAEPERPEHTAAQLAQYNVPQQLWSSIFYSINSAEALEGLPLDPPPGTLSWPELSQKVAHLRAPRESTADKWSHSASQTPSRRSLTPQPAPIRKNSTPSLHNAAPLGALPEASSEKTYSVNGPAPLIRNPKNPNHVLIPPIVRQKVKVLVSKMQSQFPFVQWLTRRVAQVRELGYSDDQVVQIVRSFFVGSAQKKIEQLLPNLYSLSLAELRDAFAELRVRQQGEDLFPQLLSSQSSQSHSHSPSRSHSQSSHSQSTLDPESPQTDDDDLFPQLRASKSPKDRLAGSPEPEFEASLEDRFG